MEPSRMWMHMSIVNCLLMFGVYTYILPNSVLAKQNLRYSGPRGLDFLVKTLADDPKEEFKVFKDTLKPMLRPRVPDTVESRLVQEHITSFFKRLDWDIEKDEFKSRTPMGLKTFTNIIVTHNPHAARKLTLACHFDSKYQKDKKTGEFYHLVSDSSVPCAILMDVASKLDCMLDRAKAASKKADITLQILFLDGEEAFVHWTAEDSLYGSRHLADLWSQTPDPGNPDKTRLEAMELFVLLDLIGTTDVQFQRFLDRRDPAGSSDKYYDGLVYIEQALAKQKLLVKKGLGPGGSRKLFKGQSYGGIEDDHKPFIAKRPELPVLHLISYPFPSVWHKKSDDEAHIDYDVTENFNRIFRVFVSNFLHLEERICKKK